MMRLFLDVADMPGPATANGRSLPRKKMAIGVPEDVHSVSDLQAHIARRLGAEPSVEGKPGLQMTLKGYSLLPEDPVGSVLRDGEHLEITLLPAAATEPVEAGAEVGLEAGLEAGVGALASQTATGITGNPAPASRRATETPESPLENGSELRPEVVRAGEEGQAPPAKRRRGQRGRKKPQQQQQQKQEETEEGCGKKKPQLQQEQAEQELLGSLGSSKAALEQPDQPSIAALEAAMSSPAPPRQDPTARAEPAAEAAAAAATNASSPPTSSRGQHQEEVQGRPDPSPSKDPRQSHEKVQPQRGQTSIAASDAAMAPPTSIGDRSQSRSQGRINQQQQQQQQQQQRQQQRQQEQEEQEQQEQQEQLQEQQQEQQQQQQQQQASSEQNSEPRKPMDTEDLAPAVFFEEGSTVRLQKLISRPEQNGKVGTVTGRVEETGKLRVALEGGKVVTVKPENLALEAPPKLSMFKALAATLATGGAGSPTQMQVPSESEEQTSTLKPDRLDGGGGDDQDATLGASQPAPAAKRARLGLLTSDLRTRLFGNDSAEVKREEVSSGPQKRKKPTPKEKVVAEKTRAEVGLDLVGDLLARSKHNLVGDLLARSKHTEPTVAEGATTSRETKEASAEAEEEEKEKEKEEKEEEGRKEHEEAAGQEDQEQQQQRQQNITEGLENSEVCPRPQQPSWQYPLQDEARRCFAGYLPKALEDGVALRFLEASYSAVNWRQPEGTWGPIPRKTSWMTKEPCNCRYGYGGLKISPEPYNDWLLALMELCMPLCGLTSRESWPNSCNLNLYEDGQHSVGWHADDERLFQGKRKDCCIISLSLGGTRSFDLKATSAPRDSVRLTLSNGDLCTMEGLVQKHYLHRIPKEARMSKARVNLTWRWVVAHEKECLLFRPGCCGVSANNNNNNNVKNDNNNNSKNSNSNSSGNISKNDNNAGVEEDGLVKGQGPEKKEHEEGEDKQQQEGTQGEDNEDDNDSDDGEGPPPSKRRRTAPNKAGLPAKKSATASQQPPKAEGSEDAVADILALPPAARARWLANALKTGARLGFILDAVFKPDFVTGVDEELGCRMFRLMQAHTDRLDSDECHRLVRSRFGRSFGKLSEQRAKEELKQVLDKTPEERSKWLSAEFKRARAQSGYTVDHLMDILIHPDFSKDVGEKVGSRLYRILAGNFDRFSAEQQATLTESCELARFADCESDKPDAKAEAKAKAKAKATATATSSSSASEAEATAEAIAATSSGEAEAKATLQATAATSSGASEAKATRQATATSTSSGEAAAAAEAEAMQTAVASSAAAAAADAIQATSATSSAPSEAAEAIAATSATSTANPAASTLPTSAAAATQQQPSDGAEKEAAAAPNQQQSCDVADQEAAATSTSKPPSSPAAADPAIDPTTTTATTASDLATPATATPAAAADPATPATAAAAAAAAAADPVPLATTTAAAASADPATPATAAAAASAAADPVPLATTAAADPAIDPTTTTATTASDLATPATATPAAAAADPATPATAATPTTATSTATTTLTTTTTAAPSAAQALEPPHAADNSNCDSSENNENNNNNHNNNNSNSNSNNKNDNNNNNENNKSKTSDRSEARGNSNGDENGDDGNHTNKATDLAE